MVDVLDGKWNVVLVHREELIFNSSESLELLK